MQNHAVAKSYPVDFRSKANSDYDTSEGAEVRESTGGVASQTKLGTF